MDKKIESNYVINIDEVLKNLKIVEDTLGSVEDTIARTGKSQSFDVLARKVENYNRVLADGQTIYRKIENNAKAYKEEVERLKKAERELIRTQAEFRDSMQYDEAERNLVAVRKRLEELQAQLRTTSQESTRTGREVGSSFSGLGSMARTAGLAIVGFFAIDKLMDFGSQIMEQTKNYQKYFAVLKNGFGDETKATQSLEMIYEFASATPFSVNEITESFIKLNNRGITPTQAELTKLGDLASSQGKGLNQLTEALLDATSGEFERLKEFGIRAKTVGDNVTLAFKGNEVTVNKFNEGALKDAVLGFGALKGVTGSMAVISQTLDGQISNLGDSYDQLLVTLGKSQGFLGTVIGLFKSLLDGVKAFIEVPIEEKLRKENAELNGLANSLILANKNETVKARLMSEISQKYPSFLALLGKESDNTYAIENALKLVNEQYRIKIKLAGQDVLAKRNAEQLADVYEKQGQQLSKADVQLKKYKYSVVQFQAMSKEQQEKVMQDIMAKTADTKLTGGGFGGQTMQSGLKEKEIAPFREIIRLTEIQRAKEQEGIDIQTKKVSLVSQEVYLKDEAVARMKEENAVMSKTLITQKEFDGLAKVGKLSKQQEQGKANFLKFKANAEEIITFAKQGVEPPKAPPKTPTAKAEKVTMKETKDEIEKLQKEEEKFQATINKMQLESENVRLSLMEKGSKDYLERKRAYDLEVIEQEKKTFADLYGIQVGNQLLEEELKKAGGKISEDNLKALKETTKQQGQDAANGTGPNSFADSKETEAQRELLRAKKAVIEFNYGVEVKAMEEKTNKEQIDRLEQHNQLLGEGLEKQIITIQNKYNKLIETYEKDLNLVKELEIKRADDIAKARLQAGEKFIDDGTGISKKTIGDRTLPSGGNQMKFEEKNKRDLLELDITFYSEKYKLLKDYLASSQYEQASSNGQISKEEKDSYEQRLDTYRKGLQGSNDSLDKFSKTSKETGQKYKDNWDVAGGVFEALTGKALKFSEDGEVDKKIRDSVDTSLNAIKDAYASILQAQIESSNERLSALDSEISERQGRVNSEFENYKAGYANNYLEEKKNLDLKKKERESELENKKKLQKEQAIIDTLTILSTNAVTVATMIDNAAKAFNATSAIPFVGVIYALGAIATIVATVASISSKAKQAVKMRYGGEIFGNLHQSGGVPVGNTGIEVEGGEFITRREQYAKKPSLFEAINNDTFGSKTVREQHEMLKPFGMKLAQSRERILTGDLQNKDRRDKAYTDNSMISQQFGMIAQGLREVASNTANISEFDYVQSGDETLKFNKKGKIVEIIQKKNE